MRETDCTSVIAYRSQHVFLLGSHGLKWVRPAWSILFPLVDSNYFEGFFKDFLLGDWHVVCNQWDPGLYFSTTSVLCLWANSPVCFCNIRLKAVPVGREAFFLFFSHGSHDKPHDQKLCLCIQVDSTEVAFGFIPCHPLRVFSIWVTNLSWSSLDWECGLMKSEITQLCPTLCDPMDCSLPSMGFSRQEYWSGLPFPSPGDLPNPGIKPRSPYCRQTLYHLSHQEAWFNEEVLNSKSKVLDSNPVFIFQKNFYSLGLICIYCYI